MMKIKYFFEDMLLWEKIVFGVSILMIVFGLGLKVVHSSQESENQQQVSLWNQRLSSVKQQLRNKQDEIKEKTEKKAAVSKDTVIASGGAQVAAYYKIDRVMKKFFETATTYHSGKQYNNRRAEIKKIASDTVFKDKYLFDPATDDDGNSLVDQYGINSEFVKAKTYLAPVEGSTLSGMTEVTFRSWYDSDGPSAAGEVTLVYSYVYNDKTGKIDGITYLGREMIV